MYAPASVVVLRKAGVLDDVRRDGFLPKDTAFKKLSGEKIVNLYNCATSHGEDALTVLPLSNLLVLLVEHCARYENIELVWNAKVVNIGQNEEKAWVEMESGDIIEGDYIVGTTESSLRASHSSDDHLFCKHLIDNTTLGKLCSSVSCRQKSISWILRKYKSLL